LVFFIIASLLSKRHPSTTKSMLYFISSQFHLHLINKLKHKIFIPYFGHVVCIRKYVFL
jgi:hypothetical protein